MGVQHQIPYVRRIFKALAFETIQKQQGLQCRNRSLLHGLFCKFGAE